MNEEDTGEHSKEVYARFGLALYHAQVLEHGLVNALVFLDLIPSRRAQVASASSWPQLLNGFMDRHFEDTMGQMLRSLAAVTAVPSELEGLLRDALQRRNWLAHDFFRERATEFLTSAGRDQMLAEVDECRFSFQTADRGLDDATRTSRQAAGISDEMLKRVTQEMIAKARGIL